jgi:Flp pilus assembly protein TadB
VSKERARRRAVRLAEAERERAARDLATARRQRRRALLRRLKPPARRTGRLYPRRSRAQRAGIVLVTLAALLLIWTQVDELALRAVLTALTVLCAPALVVLTLDRRIR